MPQSHSMTEGPLSLTTEEQSAMLRLTRLAIRSRWHPELAADIAAAQTELAHGQQPLACFVTLHEGGELRGCIGCLEAEQPLADALVYFAQAAAFSDPRFPPLQETELAHCQLSISLLGPLSPIPAASRQQVLAHLTAHRGGAVAAITRTQSHVSACRLARATRTQPVPEPAVTQRGMAN